MRDLPTTFGLPRDEETVLEVMASDRGEALFAETTAALMKLRDYLAWLSTAPMPQDEGIVAEALFKASSAGLSVLDFAFEAQSVGRAGDLGR